MIWLMIRGIGKLRIHKVISRGWSATTTAVANKTAEAVLLQLMLQIGLTLEPPN